MDYLVPSFEKAAGFVLSPAKSNDNSAPDRIAIMVDFEVSQGDEFGAKETPYDQPYGKRWTEEPGCEDEWHRYRVELGKGPYSGFVGNVDEHSIKVSGLFLEEALRSLQGVTTGPLRFLGKAV